MTAPSPQDIAARYFGGAKSDDFKKAKPSGNSDWQLPGHYYQKITSVQMKTTRKGDDGFMIESVVICVLDDADGTGHSLGTDVTHAIWAKHDSFFGNVKQFVGAVLEIDPMKLSEDDVNEIVQPDQPLADMVIEVRAKGITTRAGNPFTKVSYVGEVPLERLQAELSPEELERFDIA